MHVFRGFPFLRALWMSIVLEVAFTIVFGTIGIVIVASVYGVPGMIALDIGETEKAYAFVMAFSWVLPAAVLLRTATVALGAWWFFRRARASALRGLLFGAIFVLVYVVANYGLILLEGIANILYFDLRQALLLVPVYAPVLAAATGVGYYLGRK